MEKNEKNNNDNRNININKKQTRLCIQSFKIS